MKLPGATRPLRVDLSEAKCFGLGRTCLTRIPLRSAIQFSQTSSAFCDLSMNSVPYSRMAISMRGG